MNYRKLSKRLRTLGCQELSRPKRGSHRKWFNPATRGSTIIPYHGSQDIALGIVRKVVRDLGLSWEEFQDR